MSYRDVLCIVLLLIFLWLGRDINYALFDGHRRARASARTRTGASARARTPLDVRNVNADISRCAAQ